MRQLQKADRKVSAMRTALALAFAMLLLTRSVCALAVALPNETQQTLFYASVMEQADLSVPDQVGFDVTDVTANTGASGVTVSATSVVLDSGNALRIELKADAANFTPPSGATVTWAASDVSWAAGAWTGGTGSSGTLANGVYHTVAESSVNASELSCSDMAFTLVQKPTVNIAGEYTLTATWKFSSFTP